MAKNNLFSLQKNFTNHLIESKKTAIINILPYSKTESLARLNIYRNNVFGNFESVLSSTFEVVKKIVGEKYFQQLITEYIKNYPSKSGNLDLYGESFAKLIKKQLSQHRLLYLEDVAKIEFLYHKSYFAKNAKKSFDLEKFKKLKPQDYQNLTFKLHPSCYLISSNFPIYEIWQNNLNNSKKQIKVIEKEQFLLIDRSLNQSKISKISQAEYLFLKLINKKKKLYETYEEICRITNQEIDIGSFLNKFISSAILVDFKTN